MDKRAELLAQLVDSVADTKLEAMLNDLQSFRGHNLADELSLSLLRRWANLDGVAAAKWAQSEAVIEIVKDERSNSRNRRHGLNNFQKVN